MGLSAGHPRKRCRNIAEVNQRTVERGRIGVGRGLKSCGVSIKGRSVYSAVVTGERRGGRQRQLLPKSFQIEKRET